MHAFKAEIGKHLLKTTIFVLKVFHLFDIRGLYTAVLCFPVVVRGFRYSRFAADIFDSPAYFDGLSYGDDLVLGKLDFAHGDLLQEHNQYVGRSLKVNAPFCRDTYMETKMRSGPFYTARPDR